MNLQKRTRWILCSVSLVLLLIGLVYVTVLQQSNPKTLKNAPPAPPVQTPKTSIKHAVLQELSQQKRTLGEETQIVDTQVQVNVKRLSNDEHWAFGSVVILAPNVTGVFPEGKLFIAKHSTTNWQVTFEGMDLFSELSQQIPDVMMSAQEKKAFSLLGNAQALSQNRTELRLPYEKGQSWVMSGGPHGWSGSDRPYSSLDLYGGDQRVLAAGDGMAYTMCPNNRGWIRIYHKNGYATDYYHLWNNIIPDGQPVQEGTFLGYTGMDVSCGGYASGRHVHFSLLQGDTRISLQGKELGGWVFFENSPYNGYAMHGSTVSYTGHTLYNHGKLLANQGIVDANGGRTVNLRTSPGTNYPIVGTLNDGEVVTVSCTTNGATFTGRKGRTNRWNKLTNGYWMSDAYLYTGTNDAIASSCNK
ncbi:peptidoglycan DD-metalloendopeptidase family protein [Bacillus thuringiensis]|uniref:peptidoglycan DD-metalloendopeptidase family protein n=1 Tax=Bacillus thuringiensis TaxID=1428 RepID=UPI000BEBB096|nr:peptidoglycan DD-metalloendopeptidase family protein [Bacillus thuringiensis]EKS8367178.1 peptidoglycan DD-metalloendopeptidase family protein [Bacillus cereus]MBG9495684.1 peptidase M23 [Bacillus thuringiensis]PDY38642.1 peptidase M23 [Bacillus thuringiensis]PFE32982.1 peptidase M23 [Bacillus thuringiensis]PFT90177.1 peptidase M23 [Bacillus thuringiensis]